MLLKSKLNRVAIAVAVSVGLSTAAMAQDTSSTIRGSVATQAGEMISGATVTLTDTRTGAVRTLETNENGSFVARGLRVGGPYTITVVDAQGSRTIEDVYLNLGEPANVDIALETSSNIERIVVTGAAGGVVTEALGPSSNFNFEDLQFQPSISRDIKDVIQNDPRITIDPSNSDAIQCGGANNRFNSITVDGIAQNDNFGLNNNGYPTERLPFPFDAIDQVDVQLAPFDVTYGGFTGCNVNAVVRSGTNEIHGSVWIDYTNDAMQGDSIEGEKFDVPDFDEKRYGFTIGAPIIKDKLFIFAAYETHEPTELFEDGPEGAGFAEPIDGLTVGLLDEIRDIALNTYGYQAGDILTAADEDEEKVLIKLDWEIMDGQRASLTYQNTDGNTISATGAGSRSYAFNDRYYRRANELTSYSLQLFSDWTDDFSTEIRVGMQEVRNGQTPFTSDPDFGDVVIRDVVGSVDVFLGADRFRQANKLDYDTDTFRIAGTYFAGDHEITGGVEYGAVDVFNLFVPGSQGIFEFASLDDFRNGIASEIEYNIPASLDANDGAAAFTFENTTVFLQDRWEATVDLTLTFGLRYDKWTSDDTPTANASFQTRYGFTNAVAPDMDLLQPRLGFNYVVDDSTFVYGGAGLFAGGNPNVWLSNNYSNNGVTILASSIEDGPGLIAANTPGFLFNVPQASIDGLTGGDGAVNALDADFNVPGVWKFNLGTQHEFEDGTVAGIDAIYSRQQDSAKTIALNTVRVGRAADGRPIYEDVDLLDPDCRTSPTSSDCSGRSTTDYFLTNADDDGDSLVVSVFANKTYDSGLRVGAAYAYMDAEEGSPMNSSTASSNYGNLSTADYNNPEVATSNYEVKHRFTFSMGYKMEIFDGYDTRFNLFAQRVKGKPYSFNFDWDPGFGDERPFEDRSLLYVPLVDDPIVQYGDNFDLDAFNAFIRTRGLEGARGSILDRNTQNSNWWTRVDLRVSQELPGFMDGHRGEVYFAIRNLGNLINDDWGVYRQVNFEYNNPVVDARLLDDGTYLYTNFDGDAGQRVNADASTWSMRVGVKYRF
ncbi:TonB-dependent receptor [Alteromonas flava]|uniref:TonB-dependent receptor n=1 Tax=Alteromonas flava TaxID=2048003 RepID=UPI000C295989|nr:TonB-dependent receptor [Alteromonas flava]